MRQESPLCTKTHFLSVSIKTVQNPDLPVTAETLSFDKQLRAFYPQT